jgi:hypothetical protein
MKTAIAIAMSPRPEPAAAISKSKGRWPLSTDADGIVGRSRARQNLVRGSGAFDRRPSDAWFELAERGAPSRPGFGVDDGPKSEGGRAGVRSAFGAGATGASRVIARWSVAPNRHESTESGGSFVRSISTSLMPTTRSKSWAMVRFLPSDPPDVDGMGLAKVGE